MYQRAKKKNALTRFIRVLGPGLITGASDDDPSGIATYSQAGAQFGLSTLWTALFTFPLMATIQNMCARVGLVTQHGLAVTVKTHYPRVILYIVLGLSMPAITLNIGADIQGMGAVANMLYPSLPTAAYSIAFTLLLLFIIIRFSYVKLARILKWLCLSLLLYFIVPFLVTKNWGEVLLRTVVPTFKVDRDFVAVLVGILGTTISPYLFFWQATMEAEEMSHRKHVIVNKRLLSHVRTDVNTGMFLSNLVMYFIMLTTASVLFTSNNTNIETVDDAARALRPLAGRFSYLLFSIGVFGTGLLAIPVLAGSLSYMLAETFNWSAGLDKKFTKAKSFYVTIAISLALGLLLDFFKVNPVKSLLYTAILYGLTAPVLIAIIIHITNNKKVMGAHVNSTGTNILAFIALTLMTAAALVLLYLLIF